MRPKSPVELLEQSDPSIPLISKAKIILKLREALLQALPEMLARHCSIANFKSGNLVIFADNNAIAAKLKLLAGGLPARISDHLPKSDGQVTAVTIEVQPRFPGPPHTVKSAFISQSGAQSILALSDQVTDIKMKAVLKSLASRARK